jgi:hypothetical protein
MGINCQIYLPDRVRSNDVANAIGILAGLAVKKQPLDGGSWYVKVEGVYIRSYPPDYNLPSCAEIRFKSPIDKVDHSVMYHFENDPEGGRCLLPPSTSFWCAIGHDLVLLFGGVVNYCDTNIEDQDLKFVHSVDYDTMPRTGNAWQSLQERIFNLNTINPAKFIDVAAYKEVGK